LAGDGQKRDIDEILKTVQCCTFLLQRCSS